MTAHMELLCVKANTSTRPFPGSTNHAFSLTLDHTSEPLKFTQASLDRFASSCKEKMKKFPEIKKKKKSRNNVN